MMRNIKLLVTLVVLLVSVGFYGCQSGLQHSENGGGASQQAYFFNIEKLISDSSGEYQGIDGFGTEFNVPPYGSPPVKTTTNVTDNGALLIEPGGWIIIDIPEQFRGGGYLLEFHILYDTNENYDNTEAHFLLEDDDDNMIAQGEIEPNGSDGNIDAHQTFTLQADLTGFAGTTSVTLFNTHDSSNLEINNYMAILPIEKKNDANIFITDIRPASSRIISTFNSGMTSWDTYDSDVYTPDNFWSTSASGNVTFDLLDIVSTMTQPVIEFNYGRSNYDSSASYVTLYDDDSSEIISIVSRFNYYEDMGQTGIVDLTLWKNSSSFRLNINNRTWLNPFLKIYDAAANSSAVLLDVSPTGREYISHSGKFLFYQTSDNYLAGGMSTNNVGYRAPHWLADPTHAPYGADGILNFSIPGAVRSFSNPVLEIMHFAPDSQPNLFDECPGTYAPGCPDYYPIEFYLYDDSDNEIAHIFFDEYDVSAGGMLKNQIPLEQFKTSTTMRIVVPGVDDDRWSQLAFPPFIKIFDSIN